MLPMTKETCQVELGNEMHRKEQTRDHKTKCVEGKKPCAMLVPWRGNVEDGFRKEVVSCGGSRRDLALPVMYRVLDDRAEFSLLVGIIS